MNSNLKSTFVPQSNQSNADSDSVGREKGPIFHIQTGIRAGGFAEGRAARQAARGSTDAATWDRIL